MLMRNRTDRSKTRAYSINAITKAVFLALPILALSVQMAFASDGILKASPQPKQQKPEQAQAEHITIATPSELIEIDVVNQIIDLNAKSSYQAFRFEPDYLWLKPGTVVRFKGSTGRHTVSSIRGMYPKGAKPFEIRGRPKMDIPFDKEGVYGIRCRVHGRHGMAMLIIVGDPNVNLEKARSQKVGKKEAVKFKRLFERLDKDLANRS